MIKKIFPFIVLFSILIACNNSQQNLKEKQAEVENGRIDESYSYECKEVGWKTSLPREWNVITKKESEKLKEKGRVEIEKTMGTKIEVSGLMELVNLKKNAFNNFLSTMEPYDEKVSGSYEEQNKYVEQILLDTYKSKGIKADLKGGKEMVGGLEFFTSFISIYGPGNDSNKIILNQKMYSRLQNGYDFSMTLSYNNEKDKSTLEGILKNSTFTTYK